MHKSLQYAELARKRVETRWPGYAHPEDFGYDFREYVSPYTKGAGNLDADYLFVLQDWASAEGLAARGVVADIQRLGRDPTIRTNQRFSALLADTLGLTFADVYISNAFVFVKPG